MTKSFGVLPLHRVALVATLVVALCVPLPAMAGGAPRLLRDVAGPTDRSRRSSSLGVMARLGPSSKVIASLRGELVRQMVAPKS